MPTSSALSRCHPRRPTALIDLPDPATKAVSIENHAGSGEHHLTALPGLS
ncbi:hypothetical protein [Arthrobacter sp. BE255]|nr:hypothetical protein [Arthrobacter sp. BE255]MDR7159169.1 hypothetical protein [Arthrobacter sp. BE255]